MNEGAFSDLGERECGFLWEQNQMAWFQEGIGGNSREAVKVELYWWNLNEKKKGSENVKEIFC